MAAISNLKTAAAVLLGVVLLAAGMSPAPAAAAPPDANAARTCSNTAKFVRDVTIPDNAIMRPGQSFTKTWRLRNTGSCTWTTNYTLVRDSGDAMGGPVSVRLPWAVTRNNTVDISVSLVAPSAPGTYKGYWQLADAGGHRFGPKIYVNIIVPDSRLGEELPETLTFSVGGGGGPCAGILACVAKPTLSQEGVGGYLTISGFPPGEKATVSITAPNGRVWSRSFRIPEPAECVWIDASEESPQLGTVTALAIWPDWDDPKLTAGTGRYRVQSNSTTVEGVMELRAPESKGPRLEITRAGYPEHDLLINASAEGCAYEPIHTALLPKERASVRGTGFPENTVLTMVTYRDAALYRYFTIVTDSQGGIEIPLESMAPGDYWIAALDSPEQSFWLSESYAGATFTPNWESIPASISFSISDTGGNFSFIFCAAADFDQQSKRCLRPTTEFTRPVRIVYASWSRPDSAPGWKWGGLSGGIHDGIVAYLNWYGASPYMRLWYLNKELFLTTSNDNHFAYLESARADGLKAGAYWVKLYANDAWVAERGFIVR